MTLDRLIGILGLLLAVVFWIVPFPTVAAWFRPRPLPNAAPSPTTLPAGWPPFAGRQPSPSVNPDGPASAQRAASRALAAMTAAFPVLALCYSFFHVYFVSGNAKTPTLGTLPAAVIALSFVVIMLPLVMLVAAGRRWAVTSARAVSLAVQVVSGCLGGFLLLLSAGYILHAVGLDLPGFTFPEPARWSGALVLLIALVVIAPAFAASTMARARLATITGR